MTDASSLAARVTAIAAGEHVAAAAFLGRTPALALGDGTVVLADPGEERRVPAHPGGGLIVADGNVGRVATV